MHFHFERRICKQTQFCELSLICFFDVSHRQEQFDERRRKRFTR